MKSALLIFFAVRNACLTFSHGDFRKHFTLSLSQQDYFREAIEEYFARFMQVVELLGSAVLPEVPITGVLSLTDDTDNNAKALREYLLIAPDGPIDNRTEVLENKGILLFFLDVDNDKFSGMNGFVDGYPYIVVNEQMSPERNRSTIAHELAHLMFNWPQNLEDKSMEAQATAISGAFLFPKSDAIRERGIRRTSISKDMELVAQEYGISMYLLGKRAELSGII